MLIDHW